METAFIAYAWFGFIFMIVFFFFSYVSHIFEGVFTLQLRFNPIDEKYCIPILEAEFPFYNKLPEQSKKLFLKKLNYFYRGKNFIPKGGFQIDERKKILICATAAQLTFGLPLLKLPHFKEILIYPSSYINKHTKRKHVGEVNTHGLIVFSWEHIQRGFDDQTDGYNVCLHELAHALRFEDYYPNEERHFFDQKDVNTLHRLFVDEKKLLKSGMHPFLNKYAATNFEEFFAVSVESFFERPLKFRTAMPQLYHVLCRLLNQDPALLEEMNKKTV